MKKISKDIGTCYVRLIQAPGDRRRPAIAKDSIRIKYIGKLSNNDTQRLADFKKMNILEIKIM